MSVNPGTIYTQGPVPQATGEQQENAYAKQYAMSAAPSIQQVQSQVAQASYSQGMMGYGVTHTNQHSMPNLANQFVQGVGGQQAMQGPLPQLGMIRQQQATMVPAGMEGTRLPAANPMGLSPSGAQNMQIWQMVQNPGVPVAQVVGGLTVQAPPSGGQVAPYTQVINNAAAAGQVMNLQQPVGGSSSQAMVYPTVVQAYAATPDTNLTSVVGYNALVPSSAAHQQPPTSMNIVNVQNVAQAFPANATLLQAVNVNGQGAVVVGGAPQQVQTMVGVNQNLAVNQSGVPVNQGMTMHPGGMASVNQTGMPIDPSGRFSSAVTLNVLSNSVVTQCASTTAVASTTYMTMMGQVVTQVSPSQAGVSSRTSTHSVTSMPAVPTSSQVIGPGTQEDHQHAHTQPSPHAGGRVSHTLPQASAGSGFQTDIQHCSSISMPAAGHNRLIQPAASAAQVASATFPVSSGQVEAHTLTQGAYSDAKALFKSKCMSANSSESGSTTGADKLTCIRVPFGWKRIKEASSVTYQSPSGIFLRNREELIQYLQRDGTCKCGLECPLLIDNAFSFDPEVDSKEWTPDEILVKDDLTKLCNHKRKLVAMATLQSNTALQHHLSGDTAGGSTGSQGILEADGENKKEPGHSKKKKSKSKQPANPYDGMWVSQLLSQREKGKPVNNFPSSSAAELLKQASRLQWNHGEKPDGAMRAFSKPNFTDAPLSHQLAAMAQEKQGVYPGGMQGPGMQKELSPGQYKYPHMPHKYPNHLIKQEQTGHENMGQVPPPVGGQVPVGAQGMHGPQPPPQTGPQDNQAMWPSVQGNPMPGMVGHKMMMGSPHSNQMQNQMQSPGLPESGMQQYKQPFQVPQSDPMYCQNPGNQGEGPSKPKKRKVKKERRKVNNLLEQKRAAACPNVDVRHMQTDSCIPKEAALSDSQTKGNTTEVLQAESRQNCQEPQVAEGNEHENTMESSISTAAPASVSTAESVDQQSTDAKKPNTAEEQARSASINSCASHISSGEHGGGGEQSEDGNTQGATPTTSRLDHTAMVSRGQVVSQSVMHGGAGTMISSQPKESMATQSVPNSQPGIQYTETQQPFSPHEAPVSSKGSFQFPASSLLSAAARAQGEGRQHMNYAGNQQYPHGQGMSPHAEVAPHQGQYSHNMPSMRYSGANMGMYAAHMHQSRSPQMNSPVLPGQFHKMSPESNQYPQQPNQSNRMMAQQWFNARHPGVHPGGHPGVRPQWAGQPQLHPSMPVAGHPGTAQQAHPGMQHQGHPSSQHPSHPGMQHPGLQHAGHPGAGHPGHPAAQSVTHMTPSTPVEQSPIQKVQSMVHGLEVAQQAIEAAAAQRGFQRSASVSSGRSSTRPPSKGSQGGSTPHPSQPPTSAPSVPRSPVFSQASDNQAPSDTHSIAASPDAATERTTSLSSPHNSTQHSVSSDQHHSDVEQRVPDADAEPKDTEPSATTGQDTNNQKPPEVQENTEPTTQETKLSSTSSQNEELPPQQEAQTTQMGPQEDDQHRTEIPMDTSEQKETVENKVMSAESPAKKESELDISVQSTQSTTANTSDLTNQSGTASNLSTSSTPSKSPVQSVGDKSSPGQANTGSQPAKPKRKRDRSKKAKAAAAAARGETPPQAMYPGPPHQMGGPQMSPRWPGMVQQQAGQLYPQQLAQQMQGAVAYQQAYPAAQSNQQMQMTYNNTMGPVMMQGQYTAYGPNQAANPQMQGLPAQAFNQGYQYQQMNMGQIQMGIPPNMHMQMSPGHGGAGMVQQQQQWSMMQQMQQAQMQQAQIFQSGAGQMQAAQQSGMVSAIQGSQQQAALASHVQAAQAGMQNHLSGGQQTGMPGTMQGAHPAGLAGHMATAQQTVMSSHMQAGQQQALAGHMQQAIAIGTSQQATGHTATAQQVVGVATAVTGPQQGLAYGGQSVMNTNQAAHAGQGMGHMVAEQSSGMLQVQTVSNSAAAQHAMQQAQHAQASRQLHPDSIVMSPTSSDYGGTYGFGCELPSPCKLTRAVNAVVQSQDFDQSGLDFPSITEEQTLANLSSGIDQHAPVSAENTPQCSLTPASCALSISNLERSGSSVHSESHLIRHPSVSDSYIASDADSSHLEESNMNYNDSATKDNPDSSADSEILPNEQFSVDRSSPRRRLSSSSDARSTSDTLTNGPMKSLEADTREHQPLPPVRDVYNFDHQEHENHNSLQPNNNSDQENEVVNTQTGPLHSKMGKLPPPSDLLQRMPAKLSNDSVGRYEEKKLLIGDMIWGQIQGYPSWPGKVVRPEDVPGPTDTGPGKVWVRWFGDHTFSEMEGCQLKGLTEGLDAYQRTRSKKKGRKANAQLEAAVQEMMQELTNGHNNQDGYQNSTMDSQYNNHRKRKAKV